MAEAFGVKAKRIYGSGQIQKTVQQAVQANEGYLIEVVTDRNSLTYFCPGITQGYPVRWDKLAYLKQQGGLRFPVKRHGHLVRFRAKT